MYVRDVEPHWSMAKIYFIYECSECGAEIKKTLNEAGTTTLTRGWFVLSDMIVKRSDTIASAFCPVDHQALTT
jgi:hypothetical protein